MLYYLYGITNRDNGLQAPALASIQRLPCSELAALIEPVPGADFGPEGLERNLQCLDWVARTARRHEAVLRAAMAGGPVIPARLCTVFSDASVVVESVVKEHRRLFSTLRYLQDRSEWGLKVYCDEERLDAAIGDSDPQLRALAEAAIDATPGRAYLLTKKREARRVELRRRRAQAVIDSVIDGLESLPIGLQQRDILAAEITGHALPMVLNLAALVGADDLLAYHAEVQVLSAGLAAEGFSIETSGPWPPYSFSQDAAEDDPDAADYQAGDAIESARAPRRAGSEV